MLNFKVFGLILLTTFVFSQPYIIAQESTDRKPYGAGRFYTDNPSQLTLQLEELFAGCKQMVDGKVCALISPHAGFVYSGHVAATAFKQLDRNAEYDNIFILGSSHTQAINGASVYNAGDYLTPLGSVKVNKELAGKLISDNSYFSFVSSAHQGEHILENQLPFLQYYLENEFQIVPISIGTSNEKVLRSLVETLRPYFNGNNLFVISADFSHYPEYEDACHVDSLTAGAILKNDVKIFDETLKKNARLDHPGQVTSTCGSSAIKILLLLTEGSPTIEYVPLAYMNSGDVSFGDKQRVVGYFSLAAIEKALLKTFHLSEKDKLDLLTVARQTLDQYITTNELPDLRKSDFSSALNESIGAFVTLNKYGSLRGCIGQFTTEEPLYKTVQFMTISAALRDYRFQEVTASELRSIEIEISVLTPMQKINSIDEIELGRDGIYIEKNGKNGTFLPKVADDTGWTLEEFLGHCARDKAGIGWEGWKEADIYTYQAIVFSESALQKK